MPYPLTSREDARRPCLLLRHAAATFVASLLVLSAGLTDAHAGISRGARYAGAPWGSRSPVIAQHGMAATEQPLASLAAVEIMKKGGSAVAAAEVIGY